MSENIKLKIKRDEERKIQKINRENEREIKRKKRIEKQIKLDKKEFEKKKTRIFLIITSSIDTRSSYDTTKIRNDKKKFLKILKNRRKLRYITCINTALKFIDYKEIKPIIVDNSGKRDKYFYELCDSLFTENNKTEFPHKGGNELLDIKQVIQEYNIRDNDIIIKLTGRYRLLNNSFFDMVINNVHKYEAFIKFFNVDAKEFMHDDCVLGLFAIKCKYLKKFQYNFKRSPESEFAMFIRQNIKDKIMEINSLGLECMFSRNSKILCV